MGQGWELLSPTTNMTKIDTKNLCQQSLFLPATTPEVEETVNYKTCLAELMRLHTKLLKAPSDNNLVMKGKGKGKRKQESVVMETCWACAKANKPCLYEQVSTT